MRTAAGKTGRGFGSMPLGNVWSFPSRVLAYDTTLARHEGPGRSASAASSAGCTEVGHPIDLTLALEPEYHKAAAEVTAELRLAEPIPPLCTLVAASPFDAALHDAFGKAHGLNCYHTYGPDFLSPRPRPLPRRRVRRRIARQYIAREPQPRMPLYHLIGALDPLESTDIVKQRSTTACRRRCRSGFAPTA